MKKFVMLTLSIVMVACLLLAGCTSSGTPAESSAESSAPAESSAESSAPAESSEEASAPAESAEGEGIVIGLSMPSLQSSFFEGEMSMAEQTGKDAGVEVITVVADGDANKQKSQIEDLISKGVDAVICVPQDSVAIVSSIDDCVAAGIPFIAMGRMPDDMTNVSLAITCDNDVCAQVDVEAVVAKAAELGYDDLKAIELVGDLKDQNAAERSESFKKYCAENDIEIVGEVATEWDADKAFNRFTDLMNTMEDDFNVIYVPSDFLLTSVESVLQANDRWVPEGEDGHVLIVSIDGDPTAMNYIKEGYVLATANTDAFDFGRNAMNGAIEIAKGNMPAEVNQPIPVVALTKDIIESAGDTIWGNVYS